MGDRLGRPLFSRILYLWSGVIPHHRYFRSGLVPNKKAPISVNRVAKVSNTNG
jgi:hypothetical protein